MKHIKKLYSESYKEHGDSPYAVQWPKGRQTERFDALCMNIKTSKHFSILDFGCGLAHLNDYLGTKFNSYDYAGVDLVDEFVQAGKKKYPNATFWSTDEFMTKTDRYDYVVASGTFNIMYEKNPVNNKKFIFDSLKNLFDRANVSFAFNFMTDQVDFMQEGAFHINPIELYEYCRLNLSKRIMLNQSYMPYEFNLIVWKDDTILRPDNMYKLYE